MIEQAEFAQLSIGLLSKNKTVLSVTRTANVIWQQYERLFDTLPVIVQ